MPTVGPMYEPIQKKIQIKQGLRLQEAITIFLEKIICCRLTDGQPKKEIFAQRYTVTGYLRNFNISLNRPIMENEMSLITLFVYVLAGESAFERFKPLYC